MTGVATAQQRDTVVFDASVGIATDNNLFRLPDGVNTQALIGKPDPSERTTTTVLGMRLDKSYSLQRFKADVSLIDYKYQNFDYLNFTARNYNAAWLWSLTPRLRGNLSAERVQRLNSFDDAQNITRRNERIIATTRFDGVFDLGGAWRALGGVVRSKETNQQTVVADADYSANSANVGMRYDFASGNSVAYLRKTARGEYLNRTLSNTNLIDDSFDQTTDEVQVRWRFSGSNLVELNAAQVKRSHPHFGQRDYSASSGGVKVNWALTPKTMLVTELARELGSYQTANTNYTQTDRVTIGPVWQLSPKTVMSLSYAVARRDYLGTPSNLTASQRSDDTSTTVLKLQWQPYPSTSISASVQNSSRSSNQNNLDFNSNTAQISAQFSY